MAKQKSKKRTQAAAPKRLEKKDESTPVVSVVVMGLLGAIACFLLLGFSSLVPLLVAPLLAGVMIGLCVSPEIRAASAGAAAGAVGGLAAGMAYQADTFVGVLRGMPAYANLDITGSLYESFILPMVTADPVNTTFRLAGGAVLLAAVCALVAGAAATGVAWYVRTRRADDPRPLIAWASLALIVVAFLFTSIAGTSDSGFATTMSTEPQVGQYAFDPIINLKAVFNMTHGDDYYHALVNATAGDARMIKSKGVQNGRVAYPSPANIREPFTFYLWRVIAVFGGPGSILYASILLCSGLLVMAYAVFRPVLSYRALFVPMFVFPSLLLHTVWANVLHPDWWATLCILFGTAFLALDRPLVTGGFMLAACLMRETMLLWAAVLVVVAVVRAVRTKQWRVPIVYGGLIAVFLVAFFLHLSHAKDFITTGGSSAPFLSYITANAGAGLEHNFLAPTSYLGLPYGFFSFPLFLFLITGIAGFALVFSGKYYVRWVAAGYLLAEGLFYLTIGATSSYWGQHVMPLSLIGTAALLAWSDRALLPAASRKQPSPA